MKTNKLNKKAFVLPVIVLILYVITIFGMRFAEAKATNLYQQHTILIRSLANATTASEKKVAQDRFVKAVKLAGSDQFILNSAVYAQKGIDWLTLGADSCLANPAPQPCKVYTQEIIDSAQGRYNFIRTLTGKEPQKESVLFGQLYGPLDYLQIALTLVLESVALTLIVLWLMPTVKIKGKK